MSVPKVLSRIISIILHPFLIPTLGFLLLFNSGFYFSLIPWDVKKIVLMVVFLTTCLLPTLSISIISFNPRFDLSMKKSTDRIFPLLITSIYYYAGFYMLGKFPIFPVYRLFIISSILVQILLIIISFKWKISIHAAALGSLLGTFIALSFRLQADSTFVIALIILLSGLGGTARLILGEHDNTQIYAGFLIGFMTLFIVLSII